MAAQMDSRSSQPAPTKRLKIGPGASGAAPGLAQASDAATLAANNGDKGVAAAVSAPPSWVQMQLDAFPVL
jgi:hypothetical protein